MRRIEQLKQADTSKEVDIFMDMFDNLNEIKMSNEVRRELRRTLYELHDEVVINDS